jgi:esterase/lipase
LVTADSAQIIYDSISSQRKEIKRIENVYHAFLSEKAKKEIFSMSAQFFGIEI